MVVLYLLCIVAFEVAFAFSGVAQRYPWIVLVPLVCYGLAAMLWTRKGKKK